MPVRAANRNSSLPLAGLQRLLGPLGPQSPLLSGPWDVAADLRAAPGLTRPGAEPDLFRVGSVVAGLLAAQAGGVLVLVDDAHWMDRASLEVLAFAARRLGSEPVAMACAAAGDRPPAGLGPGIPELRLGPLNVTDAAALLHAQPRPVHASLRALVLAEAAGNPQALIELSRATAACPPGDTGPGPLPAQGRLAAMFTAQVSRLPAVTRHVMLLVAVAADGDRDVLTSRIPGLDAEALAPAEDLGLITADTMGIRFRHPLLRSVVYYSASFACRAAIHRQVADMLTAQPDRRAWHLGAAALRCDEDIAAELAASAVHARRRGGPRAMAAVLERAASLSPEPCDQAWRLIAAAEAAAAAGHADWAGNLARRAVERSPDPGLRSRGQLVIASALMSAGQCHRAAEILLPLARETAAREPAAAWKALGLAATAAYQSGDPEHLRGLAAAVAALPPAAGEQAQASRLWAVTVSALSGPDDPLPGGLALGDLALGDLALGDLALGDLALGDLALGDLALGDLALGDLALMSVPCSTLVRPRGSPVTSRRRSSCCVPPGTWPATRRHALPATPRRPHSGGPASMPDGGMTRLSSRPRQPASPGPAPHPLPRT